MAMATNATNGKSGYTGKIGTLSTQTIKAPINGGTSKTGKVITGKDLRSK